MTCARSGLLGGTRLGGLGGETRGVSPAFSLRSQHHRAFRRPARRHLLAGFAVGSSAAAVEPWADRVAARRVGIAGAVLILTGLLTQSVQYWVVIFNMRVG